MNNLNPYINPIRYYRKKGEQLFKDYISLEVILSRTNFLPHGKYERKESKWKQRQRKERD